jgi:hypothetical protein
MGGAAVAGASMITSTQVFADGGSITSRPGVPGTPTPSISGTSVSYAIPPATCTYSSPGPASARVDYRVYQTGGGATLSPQDASYVIGNPAGNPLAVGSGTRTVSGLAFGFGSVTIRIDVRWVCREPGGAAPGTPAWSCRSWTQTINYVFGIPLPGAIAAVPGSDATCAAPA